jgi:hypothetical protein
MGLGQYSAEVNSYLNATIGSTFVAQRAGVYYGEESWILAQATLPRVSRQPTESRTAE